MFAVITVLTCHAVLPSLLCLLCLLCLQVQLLGATLSIGRPSGYVDPGKAAAAATIAAEALARFQVATVSFFSNQELLRQLPGTFACCRSALRAFSSMGGRLAAGRGKQHGAALMAEHQRESSALAGTW